MKFRFYVDVKKVQDRSGLSLYQISDRTGIHRASLTRMKTNKKGTLDSANKLANALGIHDLDSLISVEYIDENDN